LRKCNARSVHLQALCKHFSSASAITMEGSITLLAVLVVGVLAYLVQTLLDEGRAEREHDQDEAAAKAAGRTRASRGRARARTGAGRGRRRDASRYASAPRGARQDRPASGAARSGRALPAHVARVAYRRLEVIQADLRRGVGGRDMASLATYTLTVPKERAWQKASRCRKSTRRGSNFCGWTRSWPEVSMRRPMT
jgi:hypothetical protein